MFIKSLHRVHWALFLMAASLGLPVIAEAALAIPVTSSVPAHWSTGESMSIGSSSANVPGSGDGSGSTSTYDGLTIPQTHPRLWFNANRLTDAKRYFALHPFTAAGDDAFGNALLYQLTGNTAKAQAAIRLLMNFTISATELAGTASDTYRWNDWVPVVFDWVYDQMTESQRAAFISRYTGYVTTLMAKSWGGVGMVGNNYFWGHWRNEFNWGVATYFEQTPQAQTILDSALRTRWTAVLSYAKAGGAGGVPQEGTQYGRYMLQYPIIPLVSAANMGRNLLAETDFFKQAAQGYLLYSTSPMPVSNGASSLPQLFPFNDDEQSYGFPAANDWCYVDFMAMMAQQYPGTPTAGYIRQWLTNVGSKPSWYIRAVDKGGAGRSYSGLPLDYYAPGPSYLYAKSRWSNTASSVAFLLGAPAQTGKVGHFHLDSGSFQILRAGQWLSKETVGYSDRITGPGGRGVVGTNSTWTVNGVIVGGIGLAASYVDGPPVVTRLESAPDHVFTSVNLSRAYRASASHYTNPDGSPRDDNPNVKTLVRDFLYVRPLDTLVALDRVESTSNMTAATSVTKTFLLHFPNNPTLGTNTALGTNGNQALRLFTLVPAGQLAPSYVLVKEKTGGQSSSTIPQFRLEATTSGQARSYLINVMQARDAAGQDITATLTEDSSNFTITLSHVTLGTAVIKLGKGMASTGGSFGYATSGIPPSMTPLATSVQAIPGSH